MERSTARVVSAGIASVGVGFGFARYGYGLLLPDLRAAFALSSAALGAIATGSYAGYLLATAASPVLAVRLGTRGTVALGLALAAAGMALIAAAASPALLAVGVLVAGASSGLVWAPFSDTVVRDLPRRVQDRAQAAISSGTGWGVALAVPIALVAGASWRTAWAAFAVLALIALVWALRVLPGRMSAAAAQGLPPLRPSWFVCPRSGPLLIGALLIGLGASAYWTFAVDHVVEAGGASPGAARLLLAVVGVASILGSFAADLVRLAGGRAGLLLAAWGLSASLLLAGLAPGSWAAVLVSALLFGAAYNLVIAILVIWGALVFADRPSAGLAGIAFLMGIGMLAGPVAGGALAGPLGMDGVFALAAGVIALAGVFAPRERLSPATA